MWALAWGEKRVCDCLALTRLRTTDLLLGLSPRSVFHTLELFGPLLPNGNSGGVGAAVLGFSCLFTALLPPPHKYPRGRSQVEHLVG